MGKVPNIPSGNGYSRPAASRTWKSGVRSPLAKELHGLICQLCLKANTEKTAIEAEEKLRAFFEEKAPKQPSIMLENSVNGCSHVVDVLHLPFSRDTRCEWSLREAKAGVLFEHIADFCRAQAEYNAEHGRNGEGDLTWERYAALLTHPNKDGFTPLIQAVDSGSLLLYKDVLAELHILRQKHIIDDATFARQFTSEILGHHVPLGIAAGAGNKELYDHVAAELFQLHARKLIDNATYVRQFIHDPSSPYSPLLKAVKSNNPGIFHSLARKIRKLHQDRLIDGDTYVRLFTQRTGDGFTPLQEAIFSGNADMFQYFTDALKDALDATSKTHDEYLARYREQLETHSFENWNVFHCATMRDDARGTPNPRMIKALLAEFHEAFGNDARAHIEKLYREETRTEQFRPAFHDQQPEWLQNLLSLSDADPVKPLPRYR